MYTVETIALMRDSLVSVVCILMGSRDEKDGMM